MRATRASKSEIDDPVCSPNGGDGRLDVYLVAMGGADGQAATEICTQTGHVSRCTGFILADNLFEEAGYASLDEGARTVLPHEIFHLVQNTYFADMDRWWAEGTAQWATKELHPDLTAAGDWQRGGADGHIDLGDP